MSDIITTLHPQGDNVTNLYPNVKLENIVDTTPEDSSKVLGIGEDGKVKPVTVQVNNSTVTIKQGGVDKGSFTLNQADNATIELDAGGGSNMYATNSAISKSIPAHKEATNPIQVGDTISQLYFNTQQDIKSYLETCVDWNNGNKIININGTLVYPLLTSVGDENAAGFRELKNFDYIYGLKIKADYAPGDGKVDPELNAWLADTLNANSYKDLFSISTQNFNDSNLGLRADKNESGSGTEYTLTCYMFVNAGYYRKFVIYSSNEGFKHAENWDSAKHVYRLTHIDKSNELVITGLNETYSAGWNGVFFGAVSNLGEIILSAVKIVSSSEMPSELYMLMPNALSIISSDDSLLNNLYYINAPVPEPGVSIKVGWQVSADQAVTLDGPKKVASVNSAVSKIASSEANWMSVPEVFGNIYRDNILSTDEIKVNDILVDTSGTLGKVKELSEESFKNQHPENPFVIGDEIPVNSYLYVDASIIPDLSKLDWSQATEQGQLLFPLAPSDSFIFMQIPQTVALGSFGIKLNKPIYMMLMDAYAQNCLYFQVDPSDIDIVLSSSFFEYFTQGINKWEFPEQITHEGSIFKVPLNNAEAVTLTDINDQDVWGAFISKDGRWVEDTPISRTKVSCETLRKLPTNYENLDGIPILKLDYVIGGTEGYEFIPGNYENKYIQDLSGIIYFCDGQELRQLEGSKDLTVKVNVRNGLTTYGSSTSPNYYSVDIGLTDVTLSGTSNNYSVFAKRGTDYGWITSPSTSTSIQPGSGISVTGGADIKTISLTSDSINRSISSANSGMYVMARDGSTMSQIGWSSVYIPRGVKAGTGLVSDTYDSYTDTLSLSQDTRERLIPSTDGLDPIYKYHLVLPDSTKLSSILWEKTQSTSIGTGLVEEPTNPSEQTLKIGLSSSNLDYTQPNTKVYAKNTDSNTFGWVSLPEPSPARTVVAGTGISVESGSTSDTISLSQEVQGKLARIPDLPSGDGNYALTCTITGGVPTFAWTLAG